MILHASAFAVQDTVHGFSTRLGGSSQGPYASMNLGLSWGDEPQRVESNYRTLAQQGGFEHSELVMVRQVHGATVLRAMEVSAQSEGDGIFALREDPGPKVLGVRTADCVPVLLASLDGSRVAALHSGWRGTVANIVEQGVRALCETGEHPPTASSLCALVGPCIERDAFEVGDEVAMQFPVQHRQRYASGRWHVDLVGMVFSQLRAAGLAPEHCLRVGACTHAHPDTYFSYRRDGRPTGQMVSYIGFSA